MTKKKKTKINWFDVGDLNEVNEIIEMTAEEKENIGCDNFDSADQIISVVADPYSPHRLIVIYKLP